MTAFFDTNVLVYCTDNTAADKQARARHLVARATEAGQAVVSTQVLIELFNVLTRKKNMPAATAQRLVQAYAGWPVISSDADLVLSAIGRSVQNSLSIWDAMVVQAAVRAGADTLYSEDFQHGQSFEGVTVVNPFLPAV